MSRICKAPGCNGQRSTQFSPYCRAHRARLRRHGDINQQGVSKAELEPYLRQVDQRRQKNPESAIWDHLERRWQAVGSHARAVIGDHDRGQAVQRNELQAAREVLLITGGAATREVVDTALAMYLMQGAELHRFRSDNAFWTQLVRRVRGVASLATGETTSASGAKRLKYREMGPRTVNALKGWLVEAFGAAGLRLAQLEESEMEARRNERREFREALGELK